MRFNQLLALVGESHATCVVEIAADRPMIIYANSSLAALFGMSRKALLGLDFRSLLLDQEVLDAHKPFSVSQFSHSHMCVLGRDRTVLDVEIFPIAEDVGLPMFAIGVGRRSDRKNRPFRNRAHANENNGLASLMSP